MRISRSHVSAQRWGSEVLRLDLFGESTLPQSRKKRPDGAFLVKIADIGKGSSGKRHQMMTLPACIEVVPGTRWTTLGSRIARHPSEQAFRKPAFSGEPSATLFGARRFPNVGLFDQKQPVPMLNHR